LQFRQVFGNSLWVTITKSLTTCIWIYFSGSRGGGGEVVCDGFWFEPQSGSSNLNSQVVVTFYQDCLIPEKAAWTHESMKDIARLAPWGLFRFLITGLVFDFREQSVMNLRTAMVPPLAVWCHF
jgi:hypothetical protein